MKQEDFYAELQEILEIDQDLNADVDLTELDEFDSLAIMGLVALADQKFGKRIPASGFKDITTVASLMKLLGEENFD